MQHQSIPESFNSVLRGFRSCFTRPSFRTFTQLVAGWIVCRDRRWITRVFQAIAPRRRKHLASYYRFFSCARWDPDGLGRCLFRLLLSILPDTIEALVDDTLCRRAGPRIFGISMHHDGVASTYGRQAQRAFSFLACGHSWVILAVRIPVPWKGAGLAIPVLARLYRSPKRCSKREYRKRTELAREMLQILAQWMPSGRVLHLVGDREYACKTVLRHMDNAIDFTGPMPMDAQLFGPVPQYRGIGRPRCRGRRLASPGQRIRCRPQDWRKIRFQAYRRSVALQVQTWTCLWYTATGQRLVRVIVTRDPKGNLEDRAFFSTHHQSTVEKILERFARRWLIEVNFRDTKQLFGLNDPQNGWSRGRRPRRLKPGPQPRGNRGRHAIERTAPFIWYAYGILVVWYLHEQRWERDVERRRMECPWYASKESPSLQDMLSAAREEILARRLLAKPLLTRTLAETRKALRNLGLAA